MDIRNLLLHASLATFTLAAPAQQKTADKPSTSVVTGHVYCADTNTPARFTSVMLEPVRVVDAAGTLMSEKKMEYVSLTAVQTSLDGSYSIPSVPAGTYYVIAYKPGYLSPLASFPSDVLYHPSSEDRERIASVVPRITVEAGLPASIDLRLERGAAISGTVFFDDGSPAAGLRVRALMHIKKGEKKIWSALPSTPFLMAQDIQTDDLGHYRLIGLPAREYMVQVSLEMQNMRFGLSIGSIGGSSMTEMLSSVLFYSGGVSRQRDANSFKLSVGDERSGEDITIPLSKLHSISGVLVAAHDGHIVNSGWISLQNADDHSQVESSKVAKNDGEFHLMFVPEGDYIVHISNAADVNYEDVPNPPGTMPPTREETHVVHPYAAADQPLNVHDDLSNLTIAVPEKNAPAKGIPGDRAQ